jgi:hypothetical protein
MELNGTHEILVSADVNILTENITYHKEKLKLC